METPTDCTPVVAKELYRYKHYKANSEQAKSGIKGRWQRWNGYGWENASEPESWEYCESNDNHV